MKTADLRLQIAKEVKSIIPFDELEQTHLDATLEWIASSANLFRIQPPDKPPKHLVSYFILVDREHRSLLLGDHIKAQLWLPTGGHVRLGEHPRQTVVRESLEEVGLPAIFLNHDKPLFITNTTTVGLTPGHVDVSLWYILSGNIHTPLTFERQEFTDMNWFTFDEVLASHPAIFDPHMQRFTYKLKQFLGP